MKYLVISLPASLREALWAGVWLLVIGALVLVPGELWATGLAVSPEKLELTGQVNEWVSTEFEVANISEQVINYQISSEVPGNWLIIKPQNFSLLASDRRRVKVLARWAKAGQIATTIDIVGHQVSSSTFPALAGIKLPLTMKISSGEMTYTWAWWLLGGSLLILLGLGGWQVRKWRHHRRWWQKALAKMDLLHHKKFF